MHNAHPHPGLANLNAIFAPFLAPFAPPTSAHRQADLYAALEHIGEQCRAGEAAAQRKAAADKELQENLRRARETAVMPLLPAHLRAKRQALQTRDLLAYDGWWARQNRRELALRDALRAHLAQLATKGAQPCPR